MPTCGEVHKLHFFLLQKTPGMYVSPKQGPNPGWGNLKNRNSMSSQNDVSPGMM